MLCTVVGEFHAIFVLKVYVTFFDEELECFSEHTLERKGEKKYNIIPKKKKKEGRKEKNGVVRKRKKDYNICGICK